MRSVRHAGYVLALGVDEVSLRRPEPAPCPSRNIVQPLLKSSEHVASTQESQNSLPRSADRRPVHPRRLSRRLPTEALDLGSDPEIDVR